MWNWLYLQFGRIKWYISWDFLKTSCRTINGCALAMACSWAFRIDTAWYITCTIIIVTCKNDHVNFANLIKLSIQFIRLHIMREWVSPYLSHSQSPGEHSPFIDNCKNERHLHLNFSSLSASMRLRCMRFGASQRAPLVSIGFLCK